MEEYKRHAETAAENLDWLDHCLEQYKKENPKDASRAESYVQAVLKASIQKSAGDLYFGEYSGGMKYKDREAFESLAEKKPDINKGRSFFSKMKAKIGAVLVHNDYGALNQALEQVQKDAKKHPRFYDEAIKSCQDFGGFVFIKDVSKAATYSNDKYNKQYKLTESYKAKKNAMERGNVADVMEKVVDAMQIYKAQNPKDALRAEKYVMKTLRAYANVQTPDTVSDRMFFPSNDTRSKDSSYNLKKRTPSVTRDKSFFGRIATKLKAKQFTVNGEKRLDRILKEAVDAIKKNPAPFRDVLKDSYQNDMFGESTDYLKAVSKGAANMAKSAEKRYQDAEKKPLHQQLKQVEKNLYKDAGHSTTKTAKPQQMSDAMMKRVLKGYNDR